MEGKKHAKQTPKEVGVATLMLDHVDFFNDFYNQVSFTYSKSHHPDGYRLMSFNQCI